MVFEATQINDAVAWNQIVQHFSSSHILQSWQWGEIKQQFGWEMEPLAWRDDGGSLVAAAMLLKRRLAFRSIRTPLNMVYVPRGPLTDWSNETHATQMLGALEKIARKTGAISIKIDPAVILATGEPGGEDEQVLAAGTAYQDMLQRRGWVYSAAQVQFRNTVLVDLRQTEEEILARMKQKTRYNIRLAGRRGVTVRAGGEDDIPLLYRMYLETSLRDGFVIRSEAYYRTLWGRFLNEGLASFLIAEFGGEVLGGLILFTFGKTAWYFYGMSTQVSSERMPNYLLQWEAIRAAKRLQCDIYDLWGAPETYDERDRMWGVYRFKSGLGGKVVRTPGAWDYAPHQGMYVLFNRVLPRILNIMRRRRISQAQHEAA